jgi:hypothetical protein
LGTNEQAACPGVGLIKGREPEERIAWAERWRYAGSSIPVMSRKDDRHGGDSVSKVASRTSRGSVRDALRGDGLRVSRVNLVARID